MCENEVSIFSQPKHHNSKHHMPSHLVDPSSTCYSQPMPDRPNRHVQNRKKKIPQGLTTGATHRHNHSQLRSARKQSVRTSWTKKGRRSKNRARAITTGSPAHLWLSLTVVFPSSRRVSHAPLYKGAGSEKQNQRTAKRSCRLRNSKYPTTTQRPTTPTTIYCPTMCF